VTFAYDAVRQTITRQQDSGAAVVLGYLAVGPGSASGLTFTYFDGGNNNLGSSPASSQFPSIARIRATVATTSGTVSRYLASDAALRAY
jgi:hypothetical protein